MAENMILAGVFYFDHPQTDPLSNEENNVEKLSGVVQSTPIIAGVYILENTPPPREGISADVIWGKKI
jgi:hypothetical protein